MAKTDLELSMMSIKVILGTISAMFGISASILTAIGISVFTAYHDYSFLSQALSDANYLSPSILITIIGIVTVFIGLFGFVGCLRDSVLLVNIFAFLVSLTLIFVIGAVISAFTMDTSLIFQYLDVPVHHYTTDVEYQNEIDYLQTTLSCCGSDSFQDYSNATFSAEQSTVVYEVTNTTLPASCCTEFTASGSCYAFALHGCKNALANVVKSNAGILGVMGVSIAFIQVMGIIFAILLGKTIRRVKSERAVRRWRIQEQIINARTAELFKPYSPENTVYVKRSSSTEA